MNKIEVKGKLKDNKLPDGWAKIRLGEIIIENIKSRFKVENADNSGRYPFFTSGEAILSDSNYLVDYENVFLATGGVANIKYYKGKANYSADTYCLKAKITTKYLYYFLLKNLMKVGYKYFSGSGLKHLQKNDFKKEILILPFSYYEQQKIAEILETVDATIEKTAAIIEKYKRIKQGLMQDLITKGIDENGQIRSEETHKFKDSSLGRIPEKWEVVESGHRNITMLITDGSHFSPQSFDGNEYYIATIENIKNNKIDISSCKKISKKDYKYLQRNNCKPQIDDILFTKDGTIGIVFKFAQKEKLVLLSSIAIIRIQKILLPDYLVQYLRSNFVWKQLEILSGGSALKRVVLRDLKKILILLPSLPEQHRIASILSQIDDIIEKEQKYKEKLERIKQGLMEDLLTGIVRVKRLIKEGVESV